MVEQLPENLSNASDESLQQAVKTREARLTPLFRRWPRLSRAEMEELRQLYRERLRVAKYLGRNRPRS
jgi:hypothetical protein